MHSCREALAASRHAEGWPGDGFAARLAAGSPETEMDILLPPHSFPPQRRIGKMQFAAKYR